LYLNFIGCVYLLIGLFVLFKQGARAPFVTHFAALCLAAFVFHFYKPFGAYEDLDLAIAFLDDAALILFAPLFLHFCAIYPVRRQLFEQRRWLAALLYAPAAVLIGLAALVQFSTLPNFPEQLSDWLYKAEIAHLTAALVAGASVLVWRFVKSESAVVRQQLKWVVWGSGMAIAPFTLLYALRFIFDINAASGALGPTAERWLRLCADHHDHRADARHGGLLGGTLCAGRRSAYAGRDLAARRRRHCRDGRHRDDGRAHQTLPAGAN
ncbi:MAG: hypothetical protein LC672_07110, partial [Acidobacteria bacterium]|nr:hypothetical protein [Acidobacteriota bacterium]